MDAKDKEIQKLRRRIAGLEETLQIVTGFSGRIEKDLRQAFTVISDTMPVPMLISLEKGEILFANGKAQEILGLSESDIHNMNVADLYINKKDRAAFQKMLADHGEVRDFLVRLKKIDGSIFPAALYSQGIVFDGLDCHLKVIYDLSELKQAEEALRFKEHIIRSAASVIATANLDGKMTSVNPSFLKTWGFDGPSEVLGRHFTEFWMVEDRLEEIMTALRQQGVWRGEIQARRKDGALFAVQVSANTVFDEKGEPISLMSTTFDITARKRAEGELEKYRLQLEDKVKERTAELAVAKAQADAASMAKSDFLARMSHEIRTPLNAVTGLTNIVLKSTLTAEQRDYLNKVQIASNNLLEVINDILDFSKVEAGRLELVHAPLDLDQVLEQLGDLFSNRVGQKDLELIFTAAPAVPRQLTGDAGRLTQVLTNLIENAVKFTEAGEIVVRVELDEPVDQQTGQTAIRFEVSDTGAGIAADLMPSLFDPFTQAEGYLSRKHEGAGLGLAICRRLVKLMGGRIWAESAPGRGSTFSFTVIMEAHKEKRPYLSLSVDRHQLKTLVVDDSATARQVLVDLLESFSFNVTAVDSGDKAIVAMKQATEGEPFQVVLLDWKMPGMDGIETARSIRELEHQQPGTANRNPQTPIIVMVTAYGHELIQQEIDKAAIDTVLFKPVKPSQLFNTIMELLGQVEAIGTHRTQEPSPPTPRLPGKRVLVVEDSELNRDVVMALLEEAGIVVETAENGQIAVRKVTQSSKGFYDAVLMDIQMPVMDGYESTRRIREWESHQAGTTNQQAETRIPIIALTAHALKGEKEKCLAADMDDYLSKPLDEQDLHQVLLRWIVSQQEGVHGPKSV